MKQSKLEWRFNLIFIAVSIQALIVTSPDDIYKNESLCKSYRNHILMLAILYHVISFMIALIYTDRKTIYFIIFSIIFGIAQTLIPDNYLCSNNFLEYPLNKYPIFEFSNYCIPEYMIFSWSMYSFIIIKFCDWFYNSKREILSIIVSSLIALVFIILFEISTSLTISQQPQLQLIALWRANIKHDNVDLIYGGMPSYLILPELCLSILLSIIANIIIQPGIIKQQSFIKFIFLSFISSGFVSIIYYTSLRFFG